MSKWQKVKLGDICDILDSYRVPITAKNREVGIYPYYGANGIQDYVKDFIFDGDYVLVAEDGGYFGSKTKPISYKVSGKFWVNNHAHILKAKKDIFTDYLCYSTMFYDVSSLVNGATRQKLTQAALKEIKIPLPPMEEQKKIAARLDAVSDLLAKQKQLLSEQDTLIQSTFYDIFGDPIKNEKGWNSKKLSELGSLKNGINFQKNDNESDLYCLGVADFKDNKYISDISALQKVPSKSVNLTEDLLKNGDIVFVRSNGNKALVGRCVAVYPNEEAVTFSGFCIRFRKSTTLIKTDYLLYFLKTPQVRNALAGRGANIQNLNQQILSRVNILCPPFELQQKFAAIAEQIESEKSKIKSAIAETQTLFNSMMSEYFEE